MNTVIDGPAGARRHLRALLLPAVLLFCPSAAIARMCGLAAPAAEPQPTADPLTKGAFISTATLPVPETVQYTDKKGQSHTGLAFPGLVVVLMDTETPAYVAWSRFQDLGGTIISQLPAAGFYVVQVGSGNEGKFISAVNADNRVNDAFPDMSLPSSGTASGVVDLAQYLNSVYSLNLAGIPFHVSSMDVSCFSLVGSFEGYCLVHPWSIDIVVTEAAIAYRNQPPQARERLESFEVGLGLSLKEGWDIKPLSQSHKINKVMKVGDTHTVRSVRFTLPKSPGTDLSNHWLIFRMTAMTLDSNGNDQSFGYCYAHGDRNIFSSLRK